MIYEEKDEYFDENEILNLHINAYYGELDEFKKDINEKIIENFKETITYCINEGCKKNKKFAEFCLNNFKFKNMEYQVSIAIGYILNGEWDKRLNLKHKILIFSNVYMIKEENLEKICQIKELSMISSYICTLRNKKELFQKIKNPEMDLFTKILIEVYNMENFFGNNIKFDPEARNTWFPLIFRRFEKYNERCNNFTEEIFWRKLSYESLEDIYGPLIDGKTDIFDMTNIKYIDKFIYMRDGFETNKEINKENILTDIRVLLKAKNKKIYTNIVNCKIFLLMENLECIKNNLFLEFICNAYNPEYINTVTESQAWSIIYSIIKCKNIIKLEFLEKFDYIEINSIKAAYETKSFNNIEILDQKFKECGKYCQLIDIENKKYIEKTEINIKDIKLEMKLKIEDYIY